MSQSVQQVDSKTRLVDPQAQQSVAVDFSSQALQVIKAVPGRIFGVVVTAALTGNVTFYDNATTNSGTVVGYVASTTAVGTFVPFLNGGVPLVNGVTANASATGGKLTAFVS